VAGSRENVVIAAGDCSVTVLPVYGGKISSLRVGAHELLHRPLHPYAPRNHDMGFAEGDAGGWDECLPSVSACSLNTQAGDAMVPDHGDLWRVPWQVLETSTDSVTMRASCFSLPLELTRSMILTPTPSGWRLQLLYSLTNTGTYPVPWSWAAHPLFACEPGDRVVLPGEVRTLRLEGSRNDWLGAPGGTVEWPLAHLAGGNQYDLSEARSGDSGISSKLFAGPMREAWCAIVRPAIDLRITARFDATLTPYLGLWLCYGGWPEGNGPKQVCIAPEPSTAPVDSLAEKGGWSRCLESGETVTWPIEVAVDHISTPTTDSQRLQDSPRGLGV
jgi:galactose mutarotase-like enzyme